MALPKQTMGVPLKGLNTVADPKSANVGEFDLIENMFFNRTARGGGELRKRYGGAALGKTAVSGGGAGPITSGARLATYGDERLMVGSNGLVSDPGSLWSYSSLLTAWKQSAISAVNNLGQGAMPSIGLTAEITAASAINYASADIAVNSAQTLMCIVWKDIDATAGNDGTYVATIDLTTGTKLWTQVVLGDSVSAAGWTRVVALTSSFMILVGGTTGNINSYSITYATPLAVTGPTLVAANMNASAKAAVTRNGSNDSVLIAYHSTVPDTKIVIWNSNLTSGGTTANAEIPSQALGWVDWDYSDGNGYLAFVSAATGAKVFTVTQAGPTVSATTTMDAAVTSAANVTGYKTTSGSRYHVFIEVRAATTYNCLIRRWPGSGVATFVEQRSLGIAASCFKVASSGRYYLMAAYDSVLQSGYYLIDVSDASASTQGFPVVVSSLYGLGFGLGISGCLPSAAAISSSVMSLPALKLVQSPSGRKIFAVCPIRVDFAATSLSGAKRVGENLHMPGGSTRVYDGTYPSELGFYVFPEIPTLAQTTAGSLTLLGSYQYAVVYAWPDNRGQWHRSAPSPIASITLTGANNSVNVTIPQLRVSRKDEATGGNWGNSFVFIEIYRTVASGTIFYRVNGATIPQLLNTDAADTQTFQDTSSDATVSANEILYTSGKVLPRIGPPSARLMETWRNRLFLAGTENPNELWVSNEYSVGLGGVSFSDALVIQMESEGGPITALCEMDDRLVIFKRNSIYVLTGNGPTLTGDNQYQQPTRLTATIGAVEQRGVVKTRDGVMFKSTRGIYLLGHGGQIVYAGAGVDTYNSLTVTGSCVLEDEEQVRFVTAEGRTLVYHYGFPDEQGIGEWTTFTNQAAVDCIVWNGKFVHLRSDGTVVEETVGAYTDPSSTSINAKVRLAWLSLTQFFGRFKLYGLSLLGDMMATFTLTHRIAYDYDATVAETETKAVTVATLPPLQLDPARRRATAVQVTLEETSTTQGFTVSGWGLEVGVEDGAFKAGAEKFLT